MDGEIKISLVKVNDAARTVKEYARIITSIKKPMHYLHHHTEYPTLIDK